MIKIMSKKWIEMAHEKRAHIFPTFWYWESVQCVGKIIGVEPGVYGQLFRNNEMSYLCEETGFTRVGEAIFGALKKDKLIDKIENCNQTEIPKLIELSEWFVKNDLSRKSGADLLKQHNLVHTQFMRVMEYSAMGTVMEFEKPLLSNHLLEVLRKRADDQSKLSDYFNILTTPTRSTTPQAEEIALRKLRIKELRGKLTDEELKQHRAKYSYIAFGYDGPGWSIEEVAKRLRDLSDNAEVLEKEIFEIRQIPISIGEKQKQALSELNLDEEEKYLFEVLGVLGFWKFERKLANQKSHEMMEKFIEELMQRFQLSRAQAKMIPPYEMEQVLLDGKVDGDLLNERIGLSVALFEGCKPGRVLAADDAKRFEREIEESLAVSKDIKEIKGACAFPGTVKGTVKRVDDESEMGKFNPGDILVSTSTTPKLIPIMKNAAAIVTDSGGITCHAAIVSRELKVPCVIGTKIATKVLKDGDRVEVNATNGIIKKL